MRDEFAAPSYWVPQAVVEVEYVVKKSRFICLLEPVTSREEALKRVASAKQRFPDARHHCWAYLLGKPGSTTSAAANDDGEPGGTAGKPILNVLQQRGIGDVVAIVIRYFGGIKLGAGGLTRAYSRVTRDACEQVKLIEKVPREQVTIECTYSNEPGVRQWLDQHMGQLIGSHYQQAVKLQYSLPVKSLKALQQYLAALERASLTSRHEETET